MLPTTRQAEETNDVHTSYAYWYTYPRCSDTWTKVWESSVRTGIDQRGMQGVNTPNYFKRKNRGELLPITSWMQYECKGSSQGTFSVSQACTTPPNTTKKDEYRPGVCTSSNWVLDRSNISGYVDLALGDYVPYDLLQQSAAKIYGSGWDGLTFLAELKSTIRSFGQLAERFRGLADKEVKRAKKLGTALEDIRLEARYAWRTLAYDVEDFVKMLARINSQRTRFRETEKRIMPPWTSVTTQTVDDIFSTLVLQSTVTVNVRCHGTVVADIEPPKIRFNPITTGWELTRLSFVLDWFIQVGMWLESMSFLVLATNYTAGYGWHAELSRELVVVSNTWKSGWSGQRSMTGSSTASLTQRIPSQLSLLPPMRLKLDMEKLMDLSSIAKKAIWRK